MRKFILAAALLGISTPANAQGIMLSDARRNLLTEAAKNICRSAMELKGRASDIFDRETAYLRLNSDEQLYMLSLCVLYSQGRIDELRRAR